MSFLAPSKKAIDTTSKFGGVGAAAGGIMDSFNKANEFGKVKAGLSAASGALKGAGMGAQFGPIGMAAGAVIGGAMSFIGAKKANAEAAKAEAAFNINTQRDIATASATSYDQNSQFGEVGKGWFGYGGSMGGSKNIFKKMIRPEQGKLNFINQYDFKASGRKHKHGGIYLEKYDAEIEDDETGTIFGTDEEGNEITKAPYIFSARQKDWITGKTFAAAHEDMARRAGKAESNGNIESQKTASVMRQRIDALARRQELLNEMRANKQEQSILNA
jgi:hypothetical protein